MTPHAIDYGKLYKNVYKKYKPNVLALLIGLVSRIQLLHSFVLSRNFASPFLVKKPCDGLSYMVFKKNQIYLFSVENLIYLFYIYIYLDVIYVLNVIYLLNVISRLRILPRFST